MYATLAEMDRYLPAAAEAVRKPRRRRHLDADDLVQEGRLAMWAYARTRFPDREPAWDRDLLPEDAAMKAARAGMTAFALANRPLELTADDLADARDDGEGTAEEILKARLSHEDFRFLALVLGLGGHTPQGVARAYRHAYRNRNRSGDRKLPDPAHAAKSWERLLAKAKRVLGEAGVIPARVLARAPAC